MPAVAVGSTTALFMIGTNTGTARRMAYVLISAIVVGAGASLAEYAVASYANEANKKVNRRKNFVYLPVEHRWLRFETPIC